MQVSRGGYVLAARVSSSSTRWCDLTGLCQGLVAKASGMRLQPLLLFGSLCSSSSPGRCVAAWLVPAFPEWNSQCWAVPVKLSIHSSTWYFLIAVGERPPPANRMNCQVTLLMSCGEVSLLISCEEVVQQLAWEYLVSVGHRGEMPAQAVQARRNWGSW